VMPETVVRAVAAAAYSTIRNILLGAWGYTSDLQQITPEAQNEALKQLEAILNPPRQESLIG